MKGWLDKLYCLQDDLLGDGDQDETGEEQPATPGCIHLDQNFLWNFLTAPSELIELTLVSEIVLKEGIFLFLFFKLFSSKLESHGTKEHSLLIKIFGYSTNFAGAELATAVYDVMCDFNSARNENPLTESGTSRNAFVIVTLSRMSDIILQLSFIPPSHIIVI